MQGLRRQAGVGIADNFQIAAVGGQPVGNAGEDNVSLAYSHTFETFREKKQTRCYRGQRHSSGPSGAGRTAKDVGIRGENALRRGRNGATEAGRY